MIPSDPPLPTFSWPSRWWMWLMDFILWVNQRQIIPDTAFFSVSETPNGMMLGFTGAVAEAIAVGVSYDAFQAVYVGVHSGSAVIRVRKGTLNNTEPTVSGDVTDPEAGWWRFEVAASTTYYGELQADIDSSTGLGTSGELSLTTTPSTTDPGNETTGDPPATAYRSLFELITDSDSVTTIAQLSRGAQQTMTIVSSWSCTELLKNVVFLP